jgi:hypothetical protein
MFTLFNLIEAPVFDHPGMPNLDNYPTTQYNKPIWQNANSPTARHCEKWKSACSIEGTIFGIIVLPFPNLGAIISLESRIQSGAKVYQITIN